MTTLPQGKGIAITAYLTFIGLIIAYFLNRDQKSPFATWHIKNMFGLFLLLICAIALQDSPIGFYIYWATFASWLFSLIMAVANQKIGIPVLSDKFQEWFTFLN
ncbi:MAG: hypothetical protein CMC08_08090 [Flavobacteriaceae bacterium]|nr:hypothetical protein [Flavobacteriaceae bacterium]